MMPQGNSSPKPRPPRAPRVITTVKASNSGGPIALMVFVLGLGGFWLYKELQKPAPPAAAKTVAAPPSAKKAPSSTPSEPDSPTPSPTLIPQPGGLASNNTPADTPSPEPTPVPAPEADQTPEAPATPAEAFARRLESEPALALVGIDATKRDQVTRHRQLLDEAASLGAWTAYRNFLGRSLVQGAPKFRLGQGAARFEAFFSDPSYYQAFLRWQVLGLFTDDQISRPDHGSALFRWLMDQNGPMEEILLTLHPRDQRGKVLEILSSAFYIAGDKGSKYFNLALACAVVFDEGLRISHPSEAGVSTEIDAITRFRWYVDHNERGKLAGPVHRMWARDLVWVVCAPVPEKELDWAIGHVHLNRSKWGNAYGMIEYLMERAVQGLNPYKEYTFAEILKEGGICGDQTYFCVNTARAQGIPAIGLSGETDLGGHAWAAVKIKDDEWTTQIGRIGGAANGAGGNPQTGGSISEQEIWLWNHRNQQSDLVTHKVHRLLWLADFFQATNPDSPHIVDAVRAAHAVSKAFPVTWQRIYNQLAEVTRRSENPGETSLLTQWEDFVDGMRDEFRENPRMAELAAKAESEFIFPYATEADARRTLSRERRRMERNSSEQKDLIADSLRREAQLILDKGSADGLKTISNLYDRALRDYGGSITGFKRMAEDYFGFVRKDPAYARDAVRDIELAFMRVVETGTKEWFRANTETSIYKMIVSYYREVGEDSRADRLEKRYQRLLKAAERGAI